MSPEKTMRLRNTAQPELLLALQHGLPLVPRPFAALGEPLGMSETAVVDCVTALFECGTARRFGAVFDSRTAGHPRDPDALLRAQRARRAFIAPSGRRSTGPR